MKIEKLSKERAD